MGAHERDVRIAGPGLADRTPRRVSSETTEGLVKLAADLGLAFYLFVELPRGDRTTFTDNLMATNWPNPLLEFYRDSDLLSCSNIVTAFRQTILPVSMGIEAFSCAAANYDNAELETLIERHGVGYSFGFTLHDVDMTVFAFIFSGSRDPLSEQERGFATTRAMELLDGMNIPERVKTAPSEKLSHRELECLRWTAAGKSSEEIGIILDLSGYTVVGYLKSAMRKLNTVNRMQAVARAYRYRLI